MGHVHETCVAMLKRSNTVPLNTGFRDPAKIEGYLALGTPNWNRDIFVGAIKNDKDGTLLESLREKMLSKNRSNIIRFFHIFFTLVVCVA